MINEYVSGATAYLALKNLASNYDTLENEFIEKLTALRDLVFQTKGLMISVTGAGPDIEQFTRISDLRTEAVKLNETFLYDIHKPFYS